MTNEQLIYGTARNDGMPESLADLIVAQSKGETGNYSSKFFTVGNNAFGYSYVSGSKWQLPDGGPNADNGIPIAQYASVQDSVHELTDWIKRRQSEGKFPDDLSTITTPAQYAQLLKNAGYYGAAETAYQAMITEWYMNITDAIKKKPGTVILMVAGVIVLGFGTYLLINRKKIA